MPRWIYQNGQAYEVGADYVPEPRNHNRVVGDLHYLDCKGPEGEDLTTRTKHKEFMSRKGLTTVDDYSNTWKDAERARIANNDPTRRQTIEQNFYRRFVK